MLHIVSILYNIQEVRGEQSAKRARMEFQRSSLLFTGILMLITHASLASGDGTELNRSSFPAAFVFGTASSAYQVSEVAEKSLQKLVR